MYLKINKGMYGLKQAAILAYNQVSSLLKAADYYPIVGSMGMWKHKHRKTIFCLCVDDFGIKYYSKDDVLHLKNTLKPQYTVKIDWSGKDFLGFNFDWDYKSGHVTLSMKHYIKRLSQNFSAK